MKNWTLDLAEGLGDIKLGMTRKEVDSLMGKATDIDEDFDEGLVTYYYMDHDLTLIFAEESDYTLVSISTMHDDCTLDGQEVMYLDKSDFIALMEKKGYNVSHEEDISDEDFPDLKAVEFDTCGLAVTFEHDTVFEVHVSYPV